jgi:hypothetical protein
MNRRRFLQAATTLPASGALAAPRPHKAPFRVLFSNDSTNILSCVSPYHQKRQPLSTEMIQATVDEVAGVDVHMLQPGLCWVPWWKSRSYPTAEHYRWVKETAGVDPDAFGRYLLAGNDLVQVFIDRCRLRRQTPFVSFRLNDGHMLENLGTKNPGAVWVSRFYAEHPEYRIGTDLLRWEQRVHNWAIPEVRDHKFGFLRELCEGYAIDGLELDFLRHTSLFRLDQTPPRERARIMTEFVARVRRCLDETARGGRRRWLCARVPCFLSGHEPLGVDLPAFVEAGLDMINLSGYYFTIQQTDLAAIRKTAPRASVYLEMTHSAWNGREVKGKYDSFPFLRTTPQQFYTGANLAYARGADGVSLFNFVYYREHGGAGRGPFHEPPFEVLGRLGDRKFVAGQPQWYVLSKSWSNATLLGPRPLPKTFKAGQRQTFALDLVSRPSRGDALFRVRFPIEAGARRWTVEANGVKLEPVAFVAKPIDHPFDACLGEAAEFACFACPRRALKAGVNEFAVTLGEGGPAVVEYLDLAYPNG